MRRRRVLVVVLLVLATMAAMTARPRTITLRPRLLHCMAPPGGAAGDWAFAFLELHNTGSRVVVMDHEALEPEVHTRDSVVRTWVELWLTPRDPQGTWFDPEKRVQLRMRLPPEAQRIVLRTHIRSLTRREYLEDLATRSGTRRLFARLYGLLWVELPNEPLWRAVVFELDLVDAKILIAEKDDPQ